MGDGEEYFNSIFNSFSVLYSNSPYGSKDIQFIYASPVNAF